jgi:uncharacterized protein (TIGR03083 family)
MSSETSTVSVLALLHASHERLASALDGLSDEQAGAQSYDDDWNIGQVASHLGSGAELFGLFVDAGTTGDPAPGIEVMQPIWDLWNAKKPAEQARDAVEADAGFLDRIDAMSGEAREAWRLDLFGGEKTLADVLTMRLNEHALHSWDITVALDPSSTVPEDAAGRVVDNLAPTAQYGGKPTEEQVSVEVRTSDPERAFHLDLGPGGVSLTPSYDDTAADAELTLPAEAFVRLVYGRLDPDHTPASVQARGVDLDLLRRAFPGV